MLVLATLDSSIFAVSSEMGIAACGFYLKDSASKLKNGYIKGSAS